MSIIQVFNLQQVKLSHKLYYSSKTALTVEDRNLSTELDWFDIRKTSTETNDRLVITSHKNILRIHDIQTKSILREFTTPGAIYSILFDQFIYVGLENKIMVFDLLEFQYEIPIEGMVKSLSIHESILCATTDSTVTLLNVSTKTVLTSVTLDTTVGKALVLTALVLVTSQNKLLVYDYGFKLVYEYTIVKEVTDIQYDGDIWISSLDKTIRQISLDGFKLVKSFKFTKGVTTFAVNDKKLVAGMNGLLAIKERKKVHVDQARVLVNEPGIVIEKTRKKKLSKHRKLLESFQYTLALESAITYPFDILQELEYRNALEQTVLALGEKEKMTLLKIVGKWIGGEKVEMAVKVLEILLSDSTIIGSSVQDDTLLKIHQRLVNEIQLQQRIFEVIGLLGGIMQQ